ncbi:MAG: LamG domain-containing protein [Candidatus Woesearchaeota archaeon]
MKAQSSTEFVLLIGFVLLIFAIFVVLIQSRTYDALMQNTKDRAGQVEGIIMNEILLAQESVDGYSRIFQLPSSLDGLPYTIFRADSREIVILYDGGERVIFLPANVTLINITNGYSQITKTNGRIFIEDATNVDCFDTDGDGYNGTGFTCSVSSPFYDCDETSGFGVAVTINKGALENTDVTCQDTHDNDCDFYIDCNDPDCGLVDACRIISQVGFIPASDFCDAPSDCVSTKVYGSEVRLSEDSTAGSILTPYLDATNRTRWRDLTWHVANSVAGKVPVNPSMVAYYHFDTNAIPSVDSSPHSNDLTDNSGLIWNASGILGGMYESKNENTSLNTTSASGITAGNFTFEAWVYYRGALVPGSFGGVIRAGTWRIFLSDNVNPVIIYQVFNPPIPWKTSGTVTMSKNEWTHIAVTVSNDTNQKIGFFINGNEFTDVIAGKADDPGTVLLVGASQNNDFELNGFLDEVILWDHELSPDEIFDHMSAPFSTLKLQVCASDDSLSSDCDFPFQFRGPDGTSSSYYTGQDMNKFTLTNVPDGRYLRARLLFLNSRGMGSPRFMYLNATGIVLG